MSTRQDDGWSRDDRVFNTPVFTAPDRLLTSPTFGQVRGSQLEREIQLAAKLLF